MFPGQNQTPLNFRVEVDRTSLADTVQTVREAIGQGLTSAVQGVQGGADRVATTSAVAMASAQGHLGFLESTRARLTPDKALGSDSSATMTLMRAAAVRAGMVDPGFSQTREGLMRAANSTMNEFRITSEERALGAVQGLSSVIGFAGTAAAFIPGVGPGIKMGLDAAFFGLEATTMGWERSVERRRMTRMLGRFGWDDATGMVRSFEDQVNGLQNVSFTEASAVARVAMANIGVENLSRDQVGTALRDAIGNYQAAGKMLGFSREQSLAETGALARLGVWRAIEVQPLFARAASAAAVTGMDPAALYQAGQQFAQGSAAIGYNAVSAGMQFQLQAGMIGESLRAGQMSRGMLTAAAGFVGPQANQIVAASQNFVTEMRAVGDTGVGRMMTAGFLAGGRGDMMSLAGAAAGMSLQDRMEFEARSKSFDPGMMARSAGAMYMRTMASMGVTPTQEALTGMFMNGLGMSLSAAGIAAMNQLHPEFGARQAFRARAAQQLATDESIAPSSGLGRFASDLRSGAGDLWDAQVAPGLRSAWRAGTDSWTATMSTAADKIWNNWSFTDRGSLGLTDREASRFIGNLSPEQLTGEDVAGMSADDFAAGMAGAGASERGALRDYRDPSMGTALRFMRRERANILGRFTNRQTQTFNLGINAIQFKLRDTGIDLSTSQAERLFGDLAGAVGSISAGGDYGKAVSRGITKVMMTPGFESMSREQASTIVNAFVGSNIYDLVPNKELLSISRSEGAERIEAGVQTMLSDEDTRRGVAGLFTKGSKSQAAFLALSAGHASARDIDSLLQSAARHREIVGRKTVLQAEREAFSMASTGALRIDDEKKEAERKAAAITAQTGKGDEKTQLAELVITLQETNNLMRQLMGRQ